MGRRDPGLPPRLSVLLVTVAGALSAAFASTPAEDEIKSGNIVFSQDDLSSLRFRVAVLLPGAALLLGLGVWLNRKA